VGFYGLLALVVILIMVSAFFSGSETGVMAVNRYRLRHLSKQGNSGAVRVSRLLQRPDRLLGIILIGNTFCNVLASAVMTYWAITYLPDLNMLFVSLLLTVFILIFAETAPKTLAALYPQRVAFAVSGILGALLKLFYPLVILVSAIANFLLRCLRVRVSEHAVEPMSAAELRSVVLDATGKIAPNYQQMLLRILALERVTVADVLVPRSDIYSIDLDDDWSTIKQQIMDCPHAHLVIYRGDIDHVEGMLSQRKVSSLLMRSEVTADDLLSVCEAVYFIPESALLNRQLYHFQDQQRSVGLVVDEYGDLVGLVTLRDIIEEIVGEFVVEADQETLQITHQKNGSVLVDGRMALRELNRQMDWDLPTDGPRTLSGLIVEYLESIPQSSVGCRIGGYPMEVLHVEGNAVSEVCIWPGLVTPSQQLSEK